MFKKQNSTPPAKQCSFTREQILHDVTAVCKNEEHKQRFNIDSGKITEKYTELKEDIEVSNKLIGNLDDLGDQKDQLLVLEKELKTKSDAVKQQIKEILECS